MRNVSRPTTCTATALSMVAVIVIGLVLFISVVQAEQLCDVTCCGSHTQTMVLIESEALTILTFEGKGIARSTLEGKAFDNCSFHLIGVRKTIDGKTTMYGNLKFVDPDGDIVVQENLLSPGVSEGTWKFIYGTGKWKGIEGSGKTKTIARGTGVAPGTVQSCIRMTGTFSLPK